MYRLLIALGMGVVAWAALGCGGSGGETSATPLTKAQFIQQADRICAQLAKQRKGAVADWEAEFSGGPAEAEAHLDEGFKDIVAPSIGREADELKDLVAPEGQETAVASMLRNLSRASRVIARQGAEAVSRSGLPEFEREAATFGLKVCPNPQ